MSDVPGPSWSDIADWYDELLVAGSGPHEHALECLDRLLPPIEPVTNALDVACGQGIAARYLAGTGAAVTGTDYSATMLANARRHSNAAGFDITWVECNAENLAPFADASFDLVTCQLGLMDIPDLDAVLRSVRRVMRVDASFVFVIGHPVFLTPGARMEPRDGGGYEVTVTDYLREHFWRSANPEGVRRAGNYQRTMSTYLTALANAGLRVVEAEERGATGRLAAERPAYGEIPMFFSARVVPA